MNLLVVLVGAYVVSLASDLGSAQVEDSEWTNYKLQHGKVYDTSSGVDAFRRSMYEHNKQRVEQFNSERPEAESFRLKVNHLSDWTESERARLRGLKPRQRGLTGGVDDDPPNSPEEQAFLDKILNDTSIPVPDALDWRKTPGRVSEVREQGFCSSDWAFAAVGALEGQQNVRRAKRRSMGSFQRFMFGSSTKEEPTITLLSEQNLVDCVTGAWDSGCGGGLPEIAFRYIKKQGGIVDEQSYPYTARTGQCQFDKSRVVFSDAGAATLPAGDEQKLKELVAKFGPVAVRIDTRDGTFYEYSSGVYSSDACEKVFQDSALLVVGYGTDPKDGDYWLVKNSWGKDWGEEGYAKMARNRGNMCGIATRPVIPTF